MAAPRKSTVRTSEVGETRLDDTVAAPATTQPGDAPYDTTDPAEVAVSVSPDKGNPESLRTGTVNAVLPLSVEQTERDSSADRWEEYPAVRPNGDRVTVRRNIDTGQSSVKGA